MLSDVKRPIYYLFFLKYYVKQKIIYVYALIARG